MAELGRYERSAGADRVKLARELKRQYVGGRSIRELAEQYGRSYGFIHKMLVEAGVALRHRGGVQAKKRV